MKSPTKDFMIRIRIHKKDHEAIRDTAGELGLTLSEFMRSAAMCRVLARASS